jgi:hypothetical protein
VQAGSNSDPNLFRARKDYVKAVATRGGIQSTPGYEGVFKTVVMFKRPYHEVSELYRLRLSAKDPALSGFPFLPVALWDERYGKDMFRIVGLSNNNFLWISWEIMNNWNHIETRGYQIGDPAYGAVINDKTNHPDTYYGHLDYYDGAYGMLIYRYQVRFW